MELLVLVIGLMTLGLLAVRFGHDSRDGFGFMADRTDTAQLGRMDLAYEQALARETRMARQRRLGVGREVVMQPQEAGEDFAQAA